MIVYYIFLQKTPYWTDENGVLCMWQAAVVAAAGNWVVTALFISPAVRLARLPAVFTCTHRTSSGLSGSVTAHRLQLASA